MWYRWQPQSIYLLLNNRYKQNTLSYKLWNSKLCFWVFEFNFFFHYNIRNITWFIIRKAPILIGWVKYTWSRDNINQFGIGKFTWKQKGKYSENRLPCESNSILNSNVCSPNWNLILQIFKLRVCKLITHVSGRKSSCAN